MEENSVALISAVVSAIISLIVCALTYYQNYIKIYSDSISKERTEWIRQTRKLASRFLAFCEANDTLNKSNALEFYMLKNEILVNLNSDGEKYANDRIIRNLLSKPYCGIRRNVPVIRKAFADIFKDEWDKAKLEAGRSKFRVKRLEKKDKELKKYFK